MGQFEQMVIVGISMSFILSIMILGSTYYNPRLWLNDYPKDIQKVVLPKSINEKNKHFISELFTILFSSERL